jgi:catechol 2,3-dioxygenase-like lactoylglutathione lyase family enzyme
MGDDPGHVNPFGHVDLRVREIGPAQSFYGELLPALGFSKACHGTLWKVFATPGELPSAAFFAITELAGHQPNGNRIAFWVADRANVDRIGELLARLGAEIESGPRACPEYSASYYAVFFRDPSGNRLEVVHRTD